MSFKKRNRQQFATPSVGKCIPTQSVGTRRGVALIAAVVTLAIGSIMLFYLLKSTIDSQRQMRTHRQEVQANWLATAGIDRAIAQLRQSANYAGEIWRVPAEQLGNTTAAEVTIKVEPAAESNARQITVQANYPADTPHRTRKSHQTTIQLP